MKHTTILVLLAAVASAVSTNLDTQPFTINFDKPNLLGKLPVALEPVDNPTDAQGRAQPIKFVSFAYNNIGSSAAPVRPQSLPNLAGTGLRVEITDFLFDVLTFKPNPKIQSARLTIDYPGSTAREFSIEKLYLACVSATAVGVSFIPISCNVNFVGTTVGGSKIEFPVTYKPQTTTVQQNMTGFVFPETFVGLKDVQVLLVDGVAKEKPSLGQKILVATTIDDVSGTVTQRE